MITSAQRRSPQVGGVLPRSIYGHDCEENAWARALESARGNIRATPVWANRRWIGVVQGRDTFLPDVRGVRLRQQANRREIESLLNDLDEDRRFDSVRRWQARQDARARKRQRSFDRAEPLRAVDIANPNDVIAAIAAGQFMRRWFQKTPTTAGVANNWYDLWPVGGSPTSGAINGTARTAVTPDDTTTGAITHGGNVSTKIKRILSIMGWSAGNTPTIMIYDRVLAYDQCSFSTSNQTMTNTLTAARYMATGQGLIPCALSGVTVLSATAASLTLLTYVDDANNSGITMPTGTTVSVIVSAAAPTATLGARVVAPSTSAQTVAWGYGLPLANGVSGVRSLTNYTWSAANTGTLTYACIYPLATVLAPVASVSGEKDLLYQYMEIPRIYDGACLALMVFQPVTTGAILQGSFSACWN